MRRYKLWLQFEGGDAASDPEGVMSAGRVKRRRAEMVAALTEGQAGAVVSEEGERMVIRGLRGMDEDVTAFLWIEETP